MLLRAGPIGGTLNRAAGGSFFALLRATSLKTPAAASINTDHAVSATETRIRGEPKLE